MLPEPPTVKPPSSSAGGGLSFRAKLLLSMILLVGGVSVSTLYAARLILQRSYRDALQGQFRSQMAFFTERQETRLAEIKERCASLAGQDSLREALRQRDAARVYAAAREALLAGAGEPAGFFRRGRPAPGETNLQREPPPGGGAEIGAPPGPGRGRGFPGFMSWLRILDAEGNLLPVPDSRLGGPFGGRRPGGPDGGTQFDQQLAALPRALDTWAFQQVAYLAPENDTAGRTLLEVVATRVDDPATGRPLGAVLLGLPLITWAEQLRDLSDILAGFWHEGQLHTHTIPEPLRLPLAARLREVVTPALVRETDFQLAHLGEVYRVFVRPLNPGSPFPLTCQVQLYSLNGALRMERRLQAVVLAVSLVVLAAGAGVSLWLANRLTRSVRELSAATSEVLRGNLQIRVPVRSRDDVGRLVDSFNQMTQGLAQKERYRRVLNMVADPHVASALVESDQPGAGERRRVTVLFCDVREFTARTRGLPPDQVVALLNEHMTALTRIVYEHQGVVDKFVGDLLMAVFGAPRSAANDAARAVTCALRLLETRAQMNQHAHPPLEVGIALASGEVIAGLMGSADRANYTVLGECVNLVSRLCAEARAGEILMDHATREQVSGLVATEPIPPLRLKGFPEPVPAWRVIRSAAGANAG